jgi:hypothetical protein
MELKKTAIKKTHLVLYIAVLFLFAADVFLVPFLASAQSTGVSIGIEGVDRIEVLPVAVNLYAGETQQFRAIAKFTWRTDLDISNDSSTVWNSDNTSCATINASHLVTADNIGLTNITATFGGKTGSARVRVLENSGTPPPPPPVAPAPPEIVPTPTQEIPPAPPLPGPPAPGAEEFAPAPQGELPPVEPTQPPVEPTQPPVEPTQPPAEPTQPPAEPTQPAAEPAQPPVEPAQPSTGGGTPASTGGIPSGQAPAAEVLPGQISGVLPGEVLPGQQPAEETIQTRINPDLLPPELKVTRGEITAGVIKEFDVENTKKDLLADCKKNIDACLSIFMGTSKYDNVVVASGDLIHTLGNAKITAGILGFGKNVANAENLLDLGNMQLYPDVPPTEPNSYAINIATLLGMVQGYYEEAGSPFKPNQVITRIEAVKVLLGATDLVKWLYYDEIEATLGGVESVKAQVTPFADIKPTHDVMWWYPRYLQEACAVQMIDCIDGSDFRPDDWITDAELADMLARLKKNLTDVRFSAYQNGDPDVDTLKTYMEQTVYFTDPLNSDTDGDGLSDNQEISIYKTSPFLPDTDFDGLNDNDEVNKYKTDPLSSDTDGDSYSDSVEITAGSDPRDPKSIPQTAEGGKVALNWEQKYNIKVVDGIQDSDHDGLSDELEYQSNTDPLNSDTDGDGFTDSEEVLQMHTDPDVANSASTLAEIGVKITNFTENQPVGDNTPLIKGVAPAGDVIRVVLRNDYGHEKVLGDTSADQNSMFVFQVIDPIRDGRYMIAAKALDPQEKRVTASDPVHIIIDSAKYVEPPAPTQISDQNISDEVLLKNLRIEIRDKQPVLIGKTEFNNTVVATWRSIVTTSALIADAGTGEFSIRAPKELSLGQHEVYVTATRKKDNAQSHSIKVLFNIGLSFPGQTAMLKPSAAVKPLDLGVVFGSISEFAQKSPALFWIIIILVVLAGGAATYLAVISKKKKRQ